MSKPVVPHFQTEWRNGLIAAAATVVFVASDMPARILSMNPDQVGMFIQINVLHAVQFGLELIRLN
ncbi:hypothetical protein [Paenibacillus thermotolerans]|uniref:hypothetical protein n=1 Tax=Paenibacillus thermotolerans TaxID=3027807 RepID=UPI00236782D7|nr:MULTISPECIES: hypothetical protein [unclassified Paenibacillus]